MATLKSGLVAIGKFILGWAVFLLIVQAVYHGWPYLLVAVLMLGPFWTVMMILGAIFIVGMILVAANGGGREMFEGMVPPIMTVIAVVIVVSILSKHVIIH